MSPAPIVHGALPSTGLRQLELPPELTSGRVWLSCTGLTVTVTVDQITSAVAGAVTVLTLPASWWPQKGIRVTAPLMRGPAFAGAIDVILPARAVQIRASQATNLICGSASWELSAFPAGEMPGMPA